MSQITLKLTDNRQVAVVRGIYFWLAIGASLFMYFVLFSYVLHKPQTIGRSRELFISKDLALHEHAANRKIILLGGSNVRTSHSASLVEEIIGLPTVNMGVSAGLSIDFQLNRIKPYLQQGDLLYLPLEYGQLARDRKAVFSGAEAPYVVGYEKSALKDFSFMRKLHAYMYFDLNFAFSALSEMSLSAMNFKRRITADDFNGWGDQTGHTLEKAEAYESYIDSTPANPTVAVDEGSYSAKAVVAFLDWASESGVIVVGGYPTYAEGKPLSDEAEESLKVFYTSRGHYFLDLENKGRYPKAHFFDTIYHLAEPYQLEHSRLVGIELKKLLNL
ncbi:hypothetical protein N9R65_04555 [Opitutales bacterium]|nr:hypothetical protein [Opitutales bacterium]MDB2681501.1 hypothetical protein [Opitutales bacterium]